MNKEETAWSVIIMALVGVAVLLFGVSAGWWWVAHQMAWWTFALAAAGFTLFWQVVVQTVKELRS